MKVASLKWMAPFMQGFILVGLAVLVALLVLVSAKWKDAWSKGHKTEVTLRIQTLMVLINTCMFLTSLTFFTLDWTVVDKYWCHFVTRLSPVLYLFSNGTVYSFLLIRIELTWPLISSLPSARLYAIARRVLKILTYCVPLFAVGVFAVFRGEVIDLDPFGEGKLVCTFVIPAWISALFAACDSFLSFGYTLFFFWSLEEDSKQLAKSKWDQGQFAPLREIARSNLRRCTIAVSSTFISLLYISVTEVFVDESDPLSKSIRIGGAFFVGLDVLINTGVLMAVNYRVWIPSFIVPQTQRVYIDVAPSSTW